MGDGDDDGVVVVEKQTGATWILLGWKYMYVCILRIWVLRV